MAAINKAIELLEKVLEENYKLSEGYEIKPETRDEIENWLKWYNDLQKRADKIIQNKDSSLTISDAINSATAQMIHYDLAIKASELMKRHNTMKVEDFRELPEVKRLWSAMDVIKEYYL